jgi:hypothetical protein
MRWSAASLPFLDLPVYRVTSQEHSQRLADDLRQHMRQAEESTPPQLFDPDFHKRLWEQAQSYPWRFNEIVGWIGLYTFGGTQIRGDLSFTTQRRLMPRGRKDFRYVRDLFRIEVHEDEDSASIYSRLRSALDQAASTERLRRRFVDISALDAIGQCLDWRQLLARERDRINRHHAPTGTANRQAQRHG